MKTAIEILQAAKEVVATSWGQGLYACTDLGNPCLVSDPAACRFCDIGAIAKVTGVAAAIVGSYSENYEGGKVIAKAKHALAKAMVAHPAFISGFCGKLPDTDTGIIVHLNDDKRMTQTITVECFEAAIESLKNEHQQA